MGAPELTTILAKLTLAAVVVFAAGFVLALVYALCCVAHDADRHLDE